MTVPKALRVSIAKVADDLFDLPLAVIGAVQEKCAVAALESKIDEQGLLVFLDGPGGIVAGAVIGPEFVGALVQQQTTGRVSALAPGGRKLTATDAALCAPILDAVFRRAHDLLETQGDRDILACYRFGAKADSKRIFLMTLDAPEYHMVRMTVDVAGGAFQSGLTLLLPVPERRSEKTRDHDDAAVPAPKASLERSVLGLNAELTAVLAKVRLPWSNLKSLSVGDEIAIPVDAFESVELVAKGGRRIGVGSMGQVDGLRAVQVEHRQEDASRPQRRASDRDDVDQPRVASLGAGKPEAQVPAPLDLPDLPAFEMEEMPPLDLPAPDDSSDAFDLPDLPDFSDLPELGDFSELDDLPKLNSA